MDPDFVDHLNRLAALQEAKVKLSLILNEFDGDLPDHDRALAALLDKDPQVIEALEE